MHHADHVQRDMRDVAESIIRRQFFVVYIYMILASRQNFLSET